MFRISGAHSLLIWNKWGLYKEEHELQIGFIKLIGSKLQLSGAETSKVTSGQSVSVLLGQSWGLPGPDHCPSGSTPVLAPALLNLALPWLRWHHCCSPKDPPRAPSSLNVFIYVVPHEFCLKRTTDAADKAWGGTRRFCILQSTSVTLLMNPKITAHAWTFKSSEKQKTKPLHFILWLQLSVQLPEFLHKDLWLHVLCSLCLSRLLD